MRDQGLDVRRWRSSPETADRSTSCPRTPRGWLGSARTSTTRDVRGTTSSPSRARRRMRRPSSTSFTSCSRRCASRSSSRTASASSPQPFAPKRQLRPPRRPTASGGRRRPIRWAKLVKTVPLAPKEVRRFSKKTTVRQSRAEREVRNHLQARRAEQKETVRAETKIVENALNKTNFQIGAKGGISIGIASVSGTTSAAQQASTSSQEAKSEFHRGGLQGSGRVQAGSNPRDQLQREPRDHGGGIGRDQQSKRRDPGHVPLLRAAAPLPRERADPPTDAGGPRGPGVPETRRDRHVVRRHARVDPAACPARRPLPGRDRQHFRGGRAGARAAGAGSSCCNRSGARTRTPRRS